MGEISRFLQNKTIFITGATGFLGKPLIAKILTEVPDVNKIYLLIRSKKQPDGSALSAQQRLEAEVFSSNVFDKLRQSHGSNFERFICQKIIGISGDIAEPNLGLEPEIYSRLTQEVQIVINSAAVVVFDEKLDEALKMNTFAPLNLLNFAKACNPNKAVFLHVSTAYVNGNASGNIPEKISNHRNIDELDVEAEYDEVLKMTQRLESESHSPKMRRRFRREVLRLSSGADKDNKDKREKLESLLEAARERWVRQQLTDYGMKRSKARGWNDTYTYTKSLGERMIVKHRGALPTVILRPSIIESSLGEPEPGWIDGFRMADPLIFGFGKGRIDDFPGNPQSVIDLIPVDFVVNAILASLLKAEREGGVRICQVATGSRNPLTFKLICDLSREYFLQNPMLDKNGKPISVPTWSFPDKRQFELKYKLKYSLPLDLAAYSIDLLPASKWTNKQRRRIEALKTSLERLLYYVKIYSPYTSLNCYFQTTNTEKLFSELSAADKLQFNFDISKINWKDYIQEVHIPGLKRNVLKLETAAATSSQYEPIEPISQTETIKTADIENLVQLLGATAKRLPDKVAWQMKRDGQWVRYTYSQCYKLAKIIGSKLKKAGFKKGDKAILYSENQPEWGITYFAAALIGVTLVPIDRQTPACEVLSLANFVKAKGILASEECLSKLSRGEPPARPYYMTFNLNELCASGSEESLKAGSEKIEIENIENIENIDQEVDLKPDDVASIIFTTGTLVEPKGVILTHRNFIADFLAVSKVLSPYENDQFLSVLPLYHAFEFTCGFLMAIYGGATVTYVDTLKSNVLLDTMREVDTTCLIAMPRLFRLLYYNLCRNLEKAGIGASDISTRAGKAPELFGGKIRVFVSGGAHLDHDIYEAFLNLGLPIYEGYGLTECAPVLAVNPPQKSKKGSVGPPVPGVQLKIDKPAENGIGEIIVKGENTSSGYYNNPAATQKVLKDGWLHTGDLGYIDEDGYLYITGRSKNIIVSGAGKNVYPEEVEAIYKNHPLIAEICVLGIRGQDTFGEETHAIIIPKKSESENLENRDRDEVYASIRRHVQNVSKEIPTYQRIQRLHICDDELPKDENSELDRKLVKETLLKRLQIQSLQNSDSKTINDNNADEALGPEDPEDWEEQVILWLSRATNLPKEQIILDGDLDDDLGLDSLMKVELLLLLEEKLGRSLPDSAVLSIKTVQDVVKFGKQKAASTKFESEFESGSLRKGLACHAPTIDFRPNIASKSFRAIMKLIYKLYFRISCDGLENVSKDEVYLIASNHSSHLDSGAIMTALGKISEKLSILGAKDYFFNNPLKAWFFSQFLNVIPFDRYNNFIQSVKISRQVLLKGRSLLIYPEGTRSTNGQLQPFKVGLGLLAYESKMSIIPAYVSGTYEALPKGRLFPKRRTIKVRFGKAIKLEAVNLAAKSKYEIYKAIVGRVRSSIEELGNRQ